MLYGNGSRRKPNNALQSMVLLSRSCQYLNQQKAWITSDILHKLLSQLNSSFKAQNRSILLFIDSAGCHRDPYDLKGRYSYIKLVFFPANCTSKLQPLDLGIIQNFKVHYRKLLLRHIITMTTDHDSATTLPKHWTCCRP